MRIAVNGVELFFDVYGPGLAARGNQLIDKPVIIALHGGPGIDHSQFVPWLTPIADVAQLILVDHRGNGRSSRPPVETRTRQHGRGPRGLAPSARPGPHRGVRHVVPRDARLDLRRDPSGQRRGTHPVRDGGEQRSPRTGTRRDARHVVARAARGAGAPEVRDSPIRRGSGSRLWRPCAVLRIRSGTNPAGRRQAGRRHRHAELVLRVGAANLRRQAQPCQNNRPNSGSHRTPRQDRAAFRLGRS